MPVPVRGMGFAKLGIVGVFGADIPRAGTGRAGPEITLERC